MALDKQLTSLGMAALGLLAERSMHPYEMYQLLICRRQDRLVKVKPGTLYHTVGRLAEANLIHAVGTEREGKRPERTSYAILPAGREALEHRLKELLARRASEYPSFPQAVAEAHNLPSGVVVELLHSRLVELGTYLNELDGDAKKMQDKSVPMKFWIESSYQQALTRAEILWIEQLRADITTGALPWQPHKSNDFMKHSEL